MTEDPNLEANIRRLLAEELVRMTCNGLARKVDSGFDQNPRTIAAINIIRTLLGVTNQPVTAEGEEK